MTILRSLGNTAAFLFDVIVWGAVLIGLFVAVAWSAGALAAVAAAGFDWVRAL